MKKVSFFFLPCFLAVSHACSSLCLSSLCSLFAFRTLLFVLRSSLSSTAAKGKKKKRGKRWILSFVFCLFFCKKENEKRYFFKPF